MGLYQEVLADGFEENKCSFLASPMSVLPDIFPESDIKIDQIATMWGGSGQLMVFLTI